MSVRLLLVAEIATAAVAHHHPANSWPKLAKLTLENIEEGGAK